jgi:hypothetical protein
VRFRNRIDDEQAIATAHDGAESRGELSYRDPRTGYQVFTAATLRGRGSCCGSGCRHCPWPAEEQRRAGRRIISNAGSEQGEV